LPVDLINPEDLPPAHTYTHVAIATGSRLVFIAGQVAEDSAGNLIGRGDLKAQSHQAFANVGRALAAAGARPDQVTKLTIFVASYAENQLAAIESGRAALFGDHRPTDTLVGVAALSSPDFLIEVDAIAVT
jgi:enamine deaminase RidA (YjgF/YER057c/UK114 family)